MGTRGRPAGSGGCDGAVSRSWGGRIAGFGRCERAVPATASPGAKREITGRGALPLEEHGEPGYNSYDLRWISSIARGGTSGSGDPRRTQPVGTVYPG